MMCFFVMALRNRIKWRLLPVACVLLAVLILLAPLHANAGVCIERNGTFVNPETGGICAGFCRDPLECPAQCTKEQLNQGWVDTEKGCSKCDKKGVEKAREELKKWLGYYKMHLATADEVFARADEAFDEAEEAIKKWAQDLAFKGVVDIGKGLEVIPESIVPALKAAYISASGDSPPKKAAKILKVLIEEMAKAQDYKDAVKIAGWANMVVSGLLMNAKVYIALNESNFHFFEGEDIWREAKMSLMRARFAAEKLAKLEAECEKGKGSPGPPSQEEEEWKTSGERDMEAAQEILQQWEKVEGGYLDADGSFHPAETSLREAEEILLHAQESSRSEYLWMAAWVGTTGAHGWRMKDGQEGLQRWIRFRQAFTTGLNHQAKAFEAMHRIGVGLRSIKDLRGDSSKNARP